MMKFCDLLDNAKCYEQVRQLRWPDGMTQYLSESIDKKRPDVTLEGEVECDEVYLVAGHKGHSDAVKKGRKGR